MDLMDRFKRVVGATRREAVEVRAGEPPPPPDPEAAIRTALAGWLEDERSRTLVTWISEQMDKAVLMAHQSYLNPTASTYNLGFEAGLRFVRDRLTKWAK
jgi:hypothetical protein